MSRPSFRKSEGDWTCDSCSNLNFARRSQCNRCGENKPPVFKTVKGGSEIGKSAAEKSKGLFSADDWMCKTCGNVNWARRNDCNMCNTPKVGIEEERTGLGGGFNERGTVEYIEREASDDEYDEFGRKKRKKKGQPAAVPEPPEPQKEEENDNEDYEEDDDDDDEDCSKYDLAASDEEEEDNKKEVKKEEKYSNNYQRSTSRSRSPRDRRQHYDKRDRHDKHRRSYKSRSRSRSRSPHRRDRYRRDY